MTALATERLVKGRDDIIRQIPQYGPAKGSTKGYAGGMAVQDANGFVKPATAAAGLVAIGLFSESYDNSTGADGAMNVGKIIPGIWPFVNSGGADAITIANVGQDCWMVDDQTVALTSNQGARSFAGRIVDVDSSFVWVRVYKGQRQANAAIDAMIASFPKTAADGAAATATAETAIGYAQDPVTVQRVEFVPAAALTGDPNNNATITVFKRTAGGAAVAIAALTTTANMVAWTPVAIPLSGVAGATTLAAGDAITFSITKAGTGVVVPQGALVVA